MKKFTAILLSLLLAAGLAACSSNDDEGKTASVVSNNNRNLNTAEDDDYIYFAGLTALQRISKADGEVVDIRKTDPMAGNTITALECFDGKVYVMTISNRFVCFDSEGNMIKAAKPEPEGLEDMPRGMPYYFTPYTFDGQLYLISSYKGGRSDVYHVDPDTLALRPADPDIKKRYMAPEGIVYLRLEEANTGRIYTIDSTARNISGEDFNYTGPSVIYDENMLVLFSDRDESVITNRVNYTDSYVFYAACPADDLVNYTLYRVGLDGEKKTKIVDFDFNTVFDVKYDNRYIYLLDKDGTCTRINKETFKKSTFELEADHLPFYEVADGKMLCRRATQAYYIDCESGRKVDLAPVR